MSSNTNQEEHHQFSAEVERLMDLVVHALYSEREIFLRELIANAADAIDRRRFEALTNETYALPTSPQIRLFIDKDSRLLTLSDDGIGMTKEELINNLGTIARSGTRAFEKQLKDAKPEDRPTLIGQFGVGFYSAFMVADKVEVSSRHAGSDEAWIWTSEGKGQYSLIKAEQEHVGTNIVLHIKSDADEYLESFRLESIIRKWADHIAWPIVIKQDDKETNANEGTAIWKKSRSEITDEQLEDFYRHITHLFDKPLSTLLWHAEGVFEFTALLFIPGMISPFQPVDQERKSKVRLHVRRMFITDEAELLPPWLRFVQGVVDTEDLPLNVSREMLQNTPVLARIRKALTNRVLTEIQKLTEKSEDFVKFWGLFGAVIKEGLWEHNEQTEALSKLSRFYSSSVEGLTTLAEYVSRMKENQEAIYYLVGDSKEVLETSPQLEGFKQQNIEVLLFTDAVDAFWPDRLGKFDDKPLRSITRAKEDLQKLIGDVEVVHNEDENALLTKVHDVLKDQVSEVRFTQRLVDSPVILAAKDQGPDLQMQRLMRRSDKTMPLTPPILELNAEHSWIKSLIQKLKSGKSIEDEAFILLDLARVQDGEMPTNPTHFARRIASMLT
ncbi:Chaperone protein HtpG [Commensalibacter sp. Nvir]|uniref:molecular chaperone HtpG n=1 Tax=Commensalibacter sp. Nvir TaxID=3069817 RepID=UPI002D490736|nr:Chaperone protein HtpG [Commensalibacter sp. Nvir]